MKRAKPTKFPFKCSCGKIVSKQAWSRHTCGQPIMLVDFARRSARERLRARNKIRSFNV